jgi:hypothetical protein
MCRKDGGVVVVIATTTAGARGSNNSRSSSDSRPTRDGDVIVLADREHSWYEMSWLVVFAAYTAVVVVVAVVVVCQSMCEFYL